MTATPFADAARVVLAVVAAVAATGSLSCAKDKRGATPVERETRSAELSATPSGAQAACGPRGLPPDRHFVAEGLCARIVAYDQGEVRGITFAPNGDLLAVTADGEIRRYRDVDHDRLFGAGAPETVVWARTGGDNAHNCQLDQAELYCGSKQGVKRWHYDPALDDGGAGEDVVVGMADSGRHPKHPIGIWDGWLYAVSGSADNSMSPIPADYDTQRNVVKRFPLRAFVVGRPFAWRDGEIVVRGVRNLTAIARHPGGRIVGIDNSLDDLLHRGVDIHQDNPGEAIVVVEPGKKYGYPYCFYAQRVVVNGAVVPAGTPLAAEVKRELLKTQTSLHDDRWCAANVDRPLSFLQAHSSALGMVFPEPSRPFALPERWRAGAFVALHGSWDRDTSTGYKVIWVPFAPDGATSMPVSTADQTSFPYETVFGGGKYGGPRDGEWSWSLGNAGEDPVRPVGAAISPLDGALYVSSDNRSATSRKSGAIYRIALLGR